MNNAGHARKLCSGDTNVEALPVKKQTTNPWRAKENGGKLSALLAVCILGMD